MAVSFKGAHFPQDIILTGVRWYLAYPLSTRHVEERFKLGATWPHGRARVRRSHRAVRAWPEPFACLSLACRGRHHSPQPRLGTPLTPPHAPGCVGWSCTARQHGHGRWRTGPRSLWTHAEQYISLLPISQCDCVAAVC
jgi:hypothetical protein